MTRIATFLLRYKIKRLQVARAHLVHQQKLHALGIIDIDDEIRRMEFLELAMRLDTKS